MSSVTHAKIRQRTRAPRFRRFEEDRVRDLIEAGMSRSGAIEFARREILGRARASFEYSIDQALEAQLALVELPGREEPIFRLVYPPLA